MHPSLLRLYPLCRYAALHPQVDIFDKLMGDLDEDVTEEKADRMEMVKNAGCSYLFTMKQLVELLKTVPTKSERL